MTAFIRPFQHGALFKMSKNGLGFASVGRLAQLGFPSPHISHSDCGASGAAFGAHAVFALVRWLTPTGYHLSALRAEAQRARRLLRV
jgi:hypothetical protein